MSVGDKPRPLSVDDRLLIAAANNRARFPELARIVAQVRAELGPNSVASVSVQKWPDEKTETSQDPS